MPSASPSPAPAMVSFQYDNTIPQNQTDQLKADLAYLSTHDAPMADPQMLTIMGIAKPTAVELSAWLAARAHYIVGENFDPDANGKIIQANYPFQNQNILPDILNPSPLAMGDTNVQTVMLNVGGGIYLESKLNDVLMSETIPGVGDVVVSSPRVGIVQIGEGLFTDAVNPAQNLDAKYVSISHLSTLFHEAHHSDGNGKSLGFLHATCPDGVYAGRAACDNNLNGPYLVGALVGRAMTESCADCTEADKEVLRIQYLDSFSRQLKSAPSASTQDQITQVQDLVSGCDHMVSAGITELGGCATLRAELAKLLDPANFVTATVWDSTPEGKL
jgi:hypothetical protein